MTTSERAEYVAKIRAECIQCMERAVAAGWKPKPGLFASSADGCTCAIGAVALCQLGVPTVYDVRSEDAARRYGLAGSTTCYALSSKHLGCTRHELESIEAGFEGFPNEVFERIEAGFEGFHNEVFEQRYSKWCAPYQDDDSHTRQLLPEVYYWWTDSVERCRDNAGLPFDPDFHAIGVEIRERFYPSTSFPQDVGCYGAGSCGHQHTRLRCAETLEYRAKYLFTSRGLPVPPISENATEGAYSVEDCIQDLKREMSDCAFEEHDACEWLNEHAPLEGATWGWQDGDFGLWPDEEE